MFLAGQNRGGGGVIPIDCNKSGQKSWGQRQIRDEKIWPLETKIREKNQSNYKTKNKKPSKREDFISVKEHELW